MKYFLIISLFVLGCNPKEKKPPVIIPPVIQHLKDSVLENPAMDEYSENVNARRKPPKPKPHPNDPPLPPVTPLNGCLLLDFNGHVVSRTMWNAGSFTCFSSGLSLSGEQTVFDRVVQDFSVFNPYILVTRDETVFNSYPQNKRMRVVITTSWEWFGQSGGVAYINSFTWFDDTPCFVFSSLHNYNLKNISDATSHEFGHTLGNRHQSSYDSSGVKLNEYLWGDLIMGASYNAISPRWGIGPCSLGYMIIQNDTSVIFNTLRK